MSENVSLIKPSIINNNNNNNDVALNATSSSLPSTTTVDINTKSMKHQHNNKLDKQKRNKNPWLVTKRKKPVRFIGGNNNKTKQLSNLNNNLSINV